MIAQVGRWLFSLAAILLLVLVGCGDSAPLSLDRIYGAIEVRVTDEAGNPIGGTWLELRDPARRMGVGVTDLDGSLDFQFVPPNPYLLLVHPPEGFSIRADDQNPITGLVVERGVVTTLPIIVTNRFGDVLIQIVDTAGIPIAGAQIELRTAARPFGYLSSDSLGEARYQRVPAGNYQFIVIPPPGFRIAPEQSNPLMNVRVEDQSLTTVRFRLSAIDG
jgi:hypothetical protein